MCMTLYIIHALFTNNTKVVVMLARTLGGESLILSNQV